MIVNLTALLLLAIYARYRWLSHLKERDFWRRLWFERLWDTDVLCSFHHRQAHEKKAKQVIQAKRRNSK